LRSLGDRLTPLRSLVYARLAADDGATRLESVNVVTALARVAASDAQLIRLDASGINMSAILGTFPVSSPSRIAQIARSPNVFDVLLSVKLPFMSIVAHVE